MLSFDRYLAIDYGSTNIKGILFSNSFGTTKILRSETLPIIQLGENEGDEYEYNIIRFVQSFFPEETEVILNLPIQRVTIRDIK
jgi:general secretion pathway protein L